MILRLSITKNYKSKKKRKKSMTFENAAQSWTDTINDWYGLNATVDETIVVFNSLNRDRKTYDGRSYIEVFFKDKDDGTWSPGLDTADREEIADEIELSRGNKDLPRYCDF